ncbi:N-acetylmuramoyl-L-alanine amidase [Parapedobacter tibetensis]|uniref:N-acetylmuramoyl-L-alanine amidase n=1 Tax=Parapedobacter tibetensis TaxID=2972951 RepID=UPI00214DBB9D|nr:peptidoglycan recognition family protein [Parapedobacter tibetensis]
MWKIKMVKRYNLHQFVWKLVVFLVPCLWISCARPTFRIFEKPVIFDEQRRALSLSYLEERHGIEQESPGITPRMVVLHWTSVPSVEKTTDVFMSPILPPARAAIAGASNLNVSAQFVVDRDGTIFRLLPDTVFARHCIGLNHCAIGVENVGGESMPLTNAQVKANVALIRYLHSKYPIEYVIGHHEYKDYIGHPLWKETDPHYLTEKIDPGKRFMRKVRRRIQDLRLKGSD